MPRGRRAGAAGAGVGGGGGGGGLASFCGYPVDLRPPPGSGAADLGLDFSRTSSFRLCCGMGEGECDSTAAGGGGGKLPCGLPLPQLCELFTVWAVVARFRPLLFHGVGSRTALLRLFAAYLGACSEFLLLPEITPEIGCSARRAHEWVAAAAAACGHRAKIPARSDRWPAILRAALAGAGAAHVPPAAVVAVVHDFAAADALLPTLRAVAAGDLFASGGGGGGASGAAGAPAPAFRVIGSLEHLRVELFERLVWQAGAGLASPAAGGGGSGVAPPPFFKVHFPTSDFSTAAARASDWKALARRRGSAQALSREAAQEAVAGVAGLTVEALRALAKMCKRNPGGVTLEALFEVCASQLICSACDELQTHLVELVNQGLVNVAKRGKGALYAPAVAIEDLREMPGFSDLDDEDDDEDDDGDGGGESGSGE